MQAVYYRDIGDCFFYASLRKEIAMSNSIKETNTVVITRDVFETASASLIAVSSILDAVSDQYSHTGNFSVGSVVHCRNVVDQTISLLGLDEFAGGLLDLPWN